MKKVFMLFAFLLAIVQGAWAQSSVTFVNRSWDESQQKVVEKDTTIIDYVELNGQGNDWMAIGNDVYYVVKGNASYQTLKVYNKANIVLCDGATLRCSGGIKLEKDSDVGDAEIHIYSQSSSDNEGQLIITNSYDGAAGIGGAAGTVTGDTYIHGGRLDITGGDEAAGIGGGRRKSPEVSSRETKGTGGRIFIYGGTVKAYGGEYAAGIGGGGSRGRAMAGGFGGEVNIYGGNITATGGYKAAGIGTGNCGDDYNGLEYAPMIGELSFYGGKVTATGGKYGAGIGGGFNSGGNCLFRLDKSGHITISGGEIYAYGGTDAAGIGGGENGCGCFTKITGGTVYAKGNSYGAGIGGGENTDGFLTTDHTTGLGNRVEIYGGDVTAIAGEDCKAREAKCGSAIGAGDAVANKDENYYGGELILGDDMMVIAGDAENDIERVFTSAEREAACRWRNYVRIKACAHAIPTVGSDQTMAVSYTVDSDTHTMHCRYCAYTLQENHNYVDETCTTCLKYGNTSDDLWSVTLYRASAAGSTSYADRVVMMVVKGQTFTVPAVNATEGLTLMGYATSTVGLSGIEMKDEETLTAVGTVVTPEANITYYPRYRYRYVPTWTWDDTDATATLSITCSALSSEAVNVSNITYTTSGEVKTATGTYDHDGATYTFTDTYLLPVEETIALLNAASNEETLDTYRGRKMKSIILSGRTLYEDGSWNTICLPFDISAADLNTKLLNPSELKTLSTSSFDSETGVLTLTFADATSIEAGKPYLIKWSRSSEWTNPIFNYVTIRDTYNAVTTDYVDFIGTFSPITLEANDRSVLYLGADDKLHYPTADMTFGSFRAYFQLRNDLKAGEWTSDADVRTYEIYFGNELVQKGDVNKDGKVSVGDVTYLVNILKGRITDYDTEAADVNGMSGVNEADLPELIDILMEKATVEGNHFEVDSEHKAR